MIVTTEDQQRREIEMRERVRRISIIRDRLAGSDAWKAAEEIDDLQRKVMALEAQLPT